MKRYLFTICGFIMIAALAGCGDSNKKSSTSESTSVIETTSAETTTVSNTAKTTTTITTTTKAEPLSESDLNSRYYGKYMSIGISKDWEYSSNYSYKDKYDIPGKGFFYINQDNVDYLNLTNNDDYIKEKFSESSDELYQNANSVKFIRHQINDKRSFATVTENVTAFNCFNNNYLISIKFSEGFPENDMLIIMDSFTFEDDVIKENSTTSAAPTTEKPAPNSNETLGQQNALKSAKSYIGYSAFSYLDLVEQLEYEGYSHEEAVYGADNCGADWNDEALESAMSYIDYSSFSYVDLVEQLEYEQFTHEQAVYGADNCGADWFQEAAECAESYIKYSSFSREELLDQLLYDGFTQEQAEYGVQSVGY